jgi:hypothetical protein
MGAAAMANSTYPKMAQIVYRTESRMQHPGRPITLVNICPARHGVQKVA